MIKVGDALPAATLMEYVEVEGNGCSIGSQPVKLPRSRCRQDHHGLAVPGAFLPTCSAKSMCPASWSRAETFQGGRRGRNLVPVRSTTPS